MAAKKKPQAAEEQPNEEIPVRFARTLEIIPGERPMEGEDVQALQAALIARKFHCGEEHRAGLYGPATAYAVRCFQAYHGLIVDGRAGEYTLKALGFEWKP